MVSGISPAQYKIGPKTVAALVALDFGQSLYNEVSKALGPDFKGGHVATGLGTGVIDFVLSPVCRSRVRKTSWTRRRRSGRISKRLRPTSFPAR